MADGKESYEWDLGSERVKRVLVVWSNTYELTEVHRGSWSNKSGKKKIGQGN